MLRFQKNLVVWKQYRHIQPIAYVRGVSEELSSVETDLDIHILIFMIFVSEELSSVETSSSSFITSANTSFQKNLVVWKPYGVHP